MAIKDTGDQKPGTARIEAELDVKKDAAKTASGSARRDPDEYYGNLVEGIKTDKVPSVGPSRDDEADGGDGSGTGPSEFGEDTEAEDPSSPKDPNAPKNPNDPNNGDGDSSSVTPRVTTESDGDRDSDSDGTTGVDSEDEGDGIDDPDNPQKLPKNKQQEQQEAKKKFQEMMQKRKEAFKKFFSKEGQKEFWKNLWSKILGFLKNPKVVAVILLVAILLSVMFQSCSRPSGRLPKIPMSAESKADRDLVLFVRAKSGEKDAQRQLIAENAIDIKTSVNALSGGGDAAVQAKIDQVAALLDEIVIINDNPTAIKTKIDAILTLLDEILAAKADLQSQIEAIKVKLDRLLTWVNAFGRGALVINPKDMDYIRNYQADRRIIQMLAYMVTPVALGGAGYERLKIKRIRFNYDTERKAYSKETEYTEEEVPNISSHFFGQAVDITEIDYIKCTKIEKKRIGSDKKTRLPASPIKVAWQTEKGYGQAGGPDSYGQNMHEVFMNIGSGDINDMMIEMIGDAIGIDIDPAMIRGRTFGEVARYVGIAVLKQSLDIPGNYDVGNNIGDILDSIGKAMIANTINVPIASLEGDSADDFISNLGRTIIEERMAIPYGSLKGSNSQEVLANVARRNLENALHLSVGTLSHNFSNKDDFLRLLGSGKIEDSLGFKAGSAYGGKTEFIKNVGEVSFNSVFSEPESIDDWLGIDTGRTKSFLDGSISLDDLRWSVGKKVFDSQIGIYKDLDKREQAFNASQTYFQEAASDIPLQPPYTERNLDKLINGDPNYFVPIGKNLITKIVALDEGERDLVYNWLNTGVASSELDLAYAASSFSLKTGDLERIFQLDLADTVFSRVGKSELFTRLTKSEALSQTSIVSEIRFYLDRLDIIKSNLNSIKTKTSDTEARAKIDETVQLIQNLFSAYSIKEISDKTAKIGSNVKFIQSKVPGIESNILAIQKALNEIIEGRVLNEPGSLTGSQIKATSTYLGVFTVNDILDLITGRKKISDFVYKLGAGKLETELDLPAGSLREVYDNLKTQGFNNPIETTLEGIGKAKVREYGLSGKGSGQVDADLKLPEGTTADYRSGKLDEKGFYAKVGMSVFEVDIALNFLNPILGTDSNIVYSLTGNDIVSFFNGGWYNTVIKIASYAIDSAFGLPPGSTRDLISHISKGEYGQAATDLGGAKLAGLVGLTRPISIDGDIIYNIGKAKIEETLNLAPGSLNNDNLVEKFRNYIGGDTRKYNTLDALFGLAAGQTDLAANGQMSAEDYIKKIGQNLANTAVYDYVSRYAPELKNKTIREIALALANQTGTVEEILQKTGAQMLGSVLGLNYAIPISGNFRDNLGQATIENRLGLQYGTFKENLDQVISANTTSRTEAAFHITSGQMSAARDQNSSYWSQDNKNKASLVDTILNIPNDTTWKFLTGQISIQDYIQTAGNQSMLYITVDKVTDLFGLDERYTNAIKDGLAIFQNDPDLSEPGSIGKLLNTLLNVAGVNLDSLTRFDPGTWNRIIANPKDTVNIVVEQGKKHLANWLGLDDEEAALVDVVYEQVLSYTNYRDLNGNLTNQRKQSEDRFMAIVREKTGIPDNRDIMRFVQGDIKGGLTAWGAAQFVKMYNEYFGSQGMTLDYQTVRTAYFNDPATEAAIGDAAVQRALAEAQQTNPNASFTEEEENQIRQEAIAQSRDQARKDVMYQSIDMQLHSLDENIPAGFTKAMREGTDAERWDMGLRYIGNVIHSANPDIPAEILPDLVAYFNPDSPEYKDVTKLADASLSFIDGKMKDWFGGWVQPGTAKALFTAYQNGWDFNAGGDASLINIYKNYGITLITNWADKALGLDSGTTYAIYQYFVDFQKAQSAYQAAQAAYLAAGTADEAVLGPLREKAFQAEASMLQIKASLVAFVITAIFKDQLLELDQSLGLVPGSSALLVTMAAQYFIAGAISPWTIAIFVILNLFGVYKVEVKCSACGYYPVIEEQRISTGGFSFRREPPEWAKACNSILPVFNGMNENSYKQNVIKAAQYYVHKFTSDTLYMDEKLKMSYMLPTQIIVFRDEDVTPFASDLYRKYGPAGFRLNSGLWTNSLMWDHIHVGF